MGGSAAGDDARATTFALSIVETARYEQDQSGTLARIERLVNGGCGRLGRHVLEITGVPAVTGEEGIRVAKPLGDAPATGSFTEVPRREILRT